jgi:CBS domain containing-hemolysin-like protein
MGSRLFLVLIFIFSLGFAQETSPQASIPLTPILILIGLLLLSAFMSGSETALTALGQWKIRQLREEGKDPTGAFGLLERDRTRFITTLLIGNNIVNIAIAALVTQIAIRLATSYKFSEPLAVGYATGITTLMVLIFGEITPKSIAVHNAVPFARAVIKPVYYLSVILYPIGLFFTFMTSTVLRLFRLEPRDNPLITENELRLMLQNAEESGVIEEQEQQMIRGVIDLEETVVREIMTPRVDMVAVSEDASLTELLALVKEHGYSRLPVYHETVDNVRGIVYARDLINLLNKPEKIATTKAKNIMSAPQYVPETMSVLSLLRNMRMRANHMAIVVDEFGGTAGLITLEDIIEEITGEIYDETDESEQKEIDKLAEQHYRILASAHLEDVSEKLAITFENEGEYDTLAGFLTSRLGYIPQKGESLEYQGICFTIEDADERRVISVLTSPGTLPSTSTEETVVSPVES